MNRINSICFYLGFFLSSGILVQLGNAQNQVITPDINISIRTEGPSPSPLYANVAFDWGIIIRWTGEPDALSTELSTPPAFDKLTILSSSVNVKTGNENGKLITEKSFYFHIVPPKEGDYAIETAQITYKTKEGKEDRISTTKSSFSVLPEPFSLSKAAGKIVCTTYFAVSASAIFLIVICVTLFRRKRSSYKPIEKTEPDWKEEIETLFQKAHRLRIEGDFRSFAQTLEQVVFLSLSKEFPDKNHKVLIDYKEELDAERQKIAQIFVDTQVHVKYAPGTPSPDLIDQLWYNAKSLTK